MKSIAPALLVLFCGFAVSLNAQSSQSAAQSTTTTPGSIAAAKRARQLDVLKPPTHDDLLRGAYGPYRANNDLLSYNLSLKVDPETKSITGSNTIRFRMLQDGQQIQLELSPDLTIDSIKLEGTTLEYTREERTIYVKFPAVLHKAKTYDVVFAYSGKPVTQGRFGCFSFDKDKGGKPWITTACEEEGPSIWWPNKDQWRDEPQDGMEIAVDIPNGLTDVSNGSFEGSKDLGNGYTRWSWRVHYPINNYDVALNIGNYQHFTMPKHGNTSLVFYALPEDLDRAKAQWAQVPEMLDAYEHYFGEYPFAKDGYKLVQVPYAGMEHQSAVAYGNHFENGYYGRDWTGVGISPKFDFIIIHESGHEWFGNAVSAADKCDMWIHEGWTTYLEVLYVEYRWGKSDASRYVNGLKPKVHNERSIIPPCGTNAEPPQDQYFKGALMLNTLRSVINDDTKWFADIHDFYQHFKYKNITTADVVSWWSKRTGADLTSFFDEYLRHAKLPELQIYLDQEHDRVGYKWQADETGFSMPVRVGNSEHWKTVQPSTTKTQWMAWSGTPDPASVLVDQEHFYLTSKYFALSATGEWIPISNTSAVSSK